MKLQHSICMSVNLNDKRQMDPPLIFSFIKRMRVWLIHCRLTPSGCWYTTNHSRKNGILRQKSRYTNDQILAEPGNKPRYFVAGRQKCYQLHQLFALLMNGCQKIFRFQWHSSLWTATQMQCSYQVSYEAMTGRAGCFFIAPVNYSKLTTWVSPEQNSKLCHT